LSDTAPKLLNLSYDYDFGAANTGLIRKRTDNVQPEHTATYTFDKLNRLTSAAGTAWNINWTLDQYGNRRVQEVPELNNLAFGRVGSQSLAVNARNRNADWTYDDAGDVTFDGSHHYLYDAENRLVQVDSGTSGVRFTY